MDAYAHSLQTRCLTDVVGVEMCHHETLRDSPNGVPSARGLVIGETSIHDERPACVIQQTIYIHMTRSKRQWQTDPLDVLRHPDGNAWLRGF